MGPGGGVRVAKRLSWVGLARTSRPLVGEIAALRDDLVGKGLDHVVLCGMGGSSLAPEVICATEGKELVVLDSSDPDYVRAALQDKLDRTIVVVSSKSGLHGRDRLAAARLRGRLHGRRDRPDRAHRHRHRPGQPARQERP